MDRREYPRHVEQQIFGLRRATAASSYRAGFRFAAGRQECMESVLEDDMSLTEGDQDSPVLWLQFFISGARGELALLLPLIPRKPRGL